MTKTRFEYQFLTIQKLGNSENENEDAGYPDGNLIINDQTLSCAIADGATQTIFSRLWARLLVQTIQDFYPTKNLDKLQRIINDASFKWQQEVKTKNLAWYQEEKVLLGASSTLTWLRITPKECRVFAIGDSNIFIFRNGGYKFTLPIKESIAFSNRPYLISSINKNNEVLNKYSRFRCWDWENGDEIIIATDALSCYLMKQLEDNYDLLEQIEKICGDFSSEISKLRIEKKLKNDDTSIIHIKLFRSTK